MILCRPNVASFATERRLSDGKVSFDNFDSYFCLTRDRNADRWLKYFTFFDESPREPKYDVWSILLIKVRSIRNV